MSLKKLPSIIIENTNTMMVVLSSSAFIGGCNMHNYNADKFMIFIFLPYAFHHIYNVNEEIPVYVCKLLLNIE